MSNKMWGGRFVAGPAEIMEEINASIDFDRKLAAQDIAGSKAHVAMLAQQSIVSQKDAEAIARGLDEVKGEIEAGRFAFSRALDVKGGDVAVGERRQRGGAGGSNGRANPAAGLAA